MPLCIILLPHIVPSLQSTRTNCCRDFVPPEQPTAVLGTSSHRHCAEVVTPAMQAQLLSCRALPPISSSPPPHRQAWQITSAMGTHTYSSLPPDKPRSALSKPNSSFSDIFKGTTLGTPPSCGQQTVPATAPSIKTRQLPLLLTRADCRAPQQPLNQMTPVVQESQALQDRPFTCTLQAAAGLLPAGHPEGTAQ